MYIDRIILVIQLDTTAIINVAINEDAGYNKDKVRLVMLVP